MKRSISKVIEILNRRITFGNATRLATSFTSSCCDSLNGETIVSPSARRSARVRHTGDSSESGYALVALIGIMLFSLIITTAAAPRVVFEAKREKEEEMLWRGQQVAAALTYYSAARNGQYPTKLIDLVEGFDLGSKKTRFLRPSALCDPMTPCDPKKESNWRAVYPGDPLIKELLEAYLATQMKPNSNLPPPPQALIMFAQMAGASISSDGTPLGNGNGNGNGMMGMGNNSNIPGMPGGLGQSIDMSGAGFGSGMGSNIGSSFGSNGGIGGGIGGGLSGGGLGGQSSGMGSGLGSGSGGNSSGSGGSGLGFSDDEGNRPIIGVVSRKSDRMFRSYFGIEYYDHSLFFPSIPIVAGGFVSPQTQMTMTGGSGPAPQCTGGGVLINGRCWGGLTPGILCRGPNGTSVPCQK